MVNVTKFSQEWDRSSSISRGGKAQALRQPKAAARKNQLCSSMSPPKQASVSSSRKAVLPPSSLCSLPLHPLSPSPLLGRMMVCVQCLKQGDRKGECLESKKNTKMEKNGERSWRRDEKQGQKEEFQPCSSFVLFKNSHVQMQK